MSNTQTVATFAGGVEGAAVAGAVATAPVAGVGTTYVAGTTPVLGGGLNLVNGQTAQTALALPVNWPLSAPIVVSNTGAAAALVFPGAATHQINGATAGTSYSVGAAKAVIFFYVGKAIAGVDQWIAVGA
jgi:hypothetical protein